MLEADYTALPTRTFGQVQSFGNANTCLMQDVEAIDGMNVSQLENVVQSLNDVDSLSKENF
jgi:hypothetical protein